MKANQSVKHGLPKTKAIKRLCELRGLTPDQFRVISYNKPAGHLVFEMKDGQPAPRIKS